MGMNLIHFAIASLRHKCNMTNSCRRINIIWLSLPTKVFLNYDTTIYLEKPIPIIPQVHVSCAAHEQEALSRVVADCLGAQSHISLWKHIYFLSFFCPIVSIYLFILVWHFNIYSPCCRYITSLRNIWIVYFYLLIFVCFETRFFFVFYLE